MTRLTSFSRIVLLLMAAGLVVFWAASAIINPTEGSVVEGDLEIEFLCQVGATVDLSINQPGTPAAIRGTVSDVGLLESAHNSVKIGDYLFTAAAYGDSIVVTDVSDISNPVIVESLVDSVNLDGAYWVQARDNYLFVVSFAVGNQNLAVIDISDPLDISLAATDTDPLYEYSWKAELDPDDDYLYVSSRTSNTIVAVDVSDPLEPVIVDNFTDVSFLTPEGSTIVGDVLLVGNDVAPGGSGSVYAIDISDPTNMSLLDTLSTTDLDQTQDIAVYGDFAFVSSRVTKSIVVIDITDPSDLSQVATLTDATYLDGASDLQIVGNRLFVSSVYSDSLSIIDITDPLNPEIIGAVVDATDMNTARDVVVDAGVAYITSWGAASITTVSGFFAGNQHQEHVCGGDGQETASLSTQGLASGVDYQLVSRLVQANGSSQEADVVSVTNRRTSEILSPVNGTNVTSQFLARFKCSATSEVLRYGVLDPEPTLQKVGRYYDDILLASSHKLVNYDGLVWVVSSAGDSLSAFDLSDPTDPILIGKIDYDNDGADLDWPVNLEIIDGIAYVVNWGLGSRKNGLTAINVSDPTSMYQLDNLSDTDLQNAWDIEIVDQTAIISANSYDGVVTVDISDPANLSLVNKFQTATIETPLKLIANGNLLFVGNGNAQGDTVTVLDISNPAYPVFLSSFIDDAIDYVQAMKFWQNYLVIGSRSGAIVFYTISDPLNPQRVTNLTNPTVFKTQDLDIFAGKVFSANADLANIGTGDETDYYSTFSDDDFDYIFGVALSQGMLVSTNWTGDSIEVVSGVFIDDVYDEHICSQADVNRGYVTKTISIPSLGEGDSFELVLSSRLAGTESDGYQAVHTYTIDNTDTDGDGVPNAMEDAGPNGGDGNDDGIADSLQSAVTTMVNDVTSAYITVEAENCEAVASVEIVESPEGVVDMAFPVGLFGVEAECSNGGNLKIYMDKEYDTSQWRLGLVDGQQFGEAAPGQVSFGESIINGSRVTYITMVLGASDSTQAVVVGPFIDILADTGLSLRQQTWAALAIISAALGLSFISRHRVFVREK